MRIAALGRKNYYGSGSVASGHFTACLFSIFQTLKLWNVNSRKWLTEYLQACVDKGTTFQLWNELIERYHYPGHKPLPGAQLRYFVFSRSRLLATLQVSHWYL